MEVEKKLSVEDLMKPRFKCISDYPGNNLYEVGQVIEDDYPHWGIEKYPHLFKKLEWWQERGVDVLKQVKFVKVVKYRGYWLVGDIVPAKLKIDDEFVPIGYYLRGQHYQPVFELEPATESEYLTLNKKNNEKN